MDYKQGDIILLPYPFSDLSGVKQRPAVIISKPTPKSSSFIVAKITSVIRADEFSFAIAPEAINRVLKYPSEVRTNELFTVSRLIVLKRFATINRNTMIHLVEHIKSHISVD